MNPAGGPSVPLPRCRPSQESVIDAKTREPHKTPTRAELELLQVLWKIGRGTVRDVLEALPEERRPAYTTVLTILKILTDKGFLERRRVARADVYEPVDTRRNVERGIVRDLVERVFGGSSRRLLVHLVDEGDLTLEEIRKLEDVVQAEGARGNGRNGKDQPADGVRES